MKDKELILILSYCPTKEKKETLHEFLKSLQVYRNKYSILLASHTPLDSWFFDYFDYFYFDKNNELLTDIEYRQNAWFCPWDNYVIWSSYIEVGNTLGAIWDMLIPSLSIAKNLKYQKIHYFEYDSVLEQDSELIENSKLLDTYDYVLYGNKKTHKLVGALLSFKTDKIINEWYESDKKILENLFYDKYPKVPENIIFDLINQQRTHIKKDVNKLKENGIIINKVRGNPFDWNVPFYDDKDNKLKFLSRNLSNGPFNIKIITNGILHDLGVIGPNTWNIVDLINFNDVKDLIVLKNNNKILELNFDNDDYKKRFIKYNSVLTNESLRVK
jgi:hypothetical protein